jgi:hypothetical protein
MKKQHNKILAAKLDGGGDCEAGRTVIVLKVKRRKRRQHNDGSSLILYKN